MNTFVNTAIEGQTYPQPLSMALQVSSAKDTNEPQRAAKRPSEVSESRLKEIYADISYILENKKVYLDATLSLVKLSRLLHTNTTYLSKVANDFFGCNLKTLLNRYRINYAKELLKEEECDIRQLPARCGFLSRSTFYAAFAKFEHTSPTDFRNKHMSQKLREEATVEAV